MVSHSVSVDHQDSATVTVCSIEAHKGSVHVFSSLNKEIMKHVSAHSQFFKWFPVWKANMSSPLFYFVLFCVQLPMGDGDQGCHEEVPEPHEPQCDWGGRAGPQSGWRGPPAQPQTPQHRVGPTKHRACGQSSEQTHTLRYVEIYKHMVHSVQLSSHLLCCRK